MSILRELLMAEESTQQSEEVAFAPLVEEVVSEKTQDVPSLSPVLKTVLQIVYEEYSDKLDPKALTALLFEAADIATLAIGIYNEVIAGNGEGLLEANNNASELKNELTQLQQQIHQYAEKLRNVKSDAEANQLLKELAPLKEKYVQLRKEYEQALKQQEQLQGQTSAGAGEPKPAPKEHELSLLDKIKQELDHLKQQTEHVAQQLAKEVQQGTQHASQAIHQGIQHASQLAHEHPYAAAGTGAAAGAVAAYGLYKFGKKLYKKIKNK